MKSNAAALQPTRRNSLHFILLTMPSEKYARPTSSTGTKRVTFSVTSTLVITKPKSRQESRSSWYSKKDIDSFKQRSRRAAKSMVENNAPVAKAFIEMSLEIDHINEIVCFGGKEYVCGIEPMLSHKVLQLLVTTRRLTVERVLEEQECQRITGKSNIELIAQASMKTSVFARTWRQRIAELMMD
jgi:hypothetical protein